jgi:hypothetical protein
VRSGGIATYSGGLLNGRRVNNAGTFNADNVLSLANSAVVNNTGTYNINLAGNTGTFGNSIAGSSFINSGTLNKTNSSGVVSFELPLTNLGTVHVAVGTFDLLGGGTNSGTFSSAAGAVLRFGSNFSLGSSTQLVGAGSFVVNGGTLTLGSGLLLHAANLSVVAGTVAGPGAIEVQNGETFSWSGGTLGSGSADSGEAIVEVRSGGIATYSGGLLNGRRVNNAGTFNANNVLSLGKQRRRQQHRDLQHQPRGEHRHVRQFDRREQLHQLRDAEQDEQQRSRELRAAADEPRHGACCRRHVRSARWRHEQRHLLERSWCSSALREQLLVRQRDAADRRRVLCCKRWHVDARFGIAAARGDLSVVAGAVAGPWSDRSAERRDVQLVRRNARERQR